MNAKLARAAPIPSIGHTPIDTIRVVLRGRDQIVHLKLEGENPAGSSKDRTAAALIADCEQSGRLQASSTIIESSSGNLGVSLAFVCRQRGYRFHAVVDPKTTPENCDQMRAFGASFEIVDVPDETGGYLLTRLARVQALCAADPRYVWTDQYSNPANPRAHYESTGPEIYRQLDGRIDAIFVAVSTGGTLAGIGRYFREVSPSTLIIGVDAYGSAAFGGTRAPRKLTGIGSSRRSLFIRPEHHDGYRLVGDADAFVMCRELFDAAGIYVGGSSGAVVFACLDHLARERTWADRDPPRVVCVCPDGGRNYRSSVFDDEWMRANGFDPRCKHAFVEIPHISSGEPCHLASPFSARTTRITIT